ncbi:hypothetical protein [Fodinicola feengrottensis]|uniref:hypothetical protein n=1 Tax=Fodinicola feengrottensis TaxID=435914 RepID=UPI0013D235FB|nr:hypothetical protein [Fodinicola feengrottensis]
MGVRGVSAEVLTQAGDVHAPLGQVHEPVERGQVGPRRGPELVDQPRFQRVHRASEPPGVVRGYRANRRRRGVAAIEVGRWLRHHPGSPASDRQQAPFRPVTGVLQPYQVQVPPRPRPGRHHVGFQLVRALESSLRVRVAHRRNLAIATHRPRPTPSRTGRFRCGSPRVDS